jgi:hypothetical protein
MVASGGLAGMWVACHAKALQCCEKRFRLREPEGRKNMTKQDHRKNAPAQLGQGFAHQVSVCRTCTAGNGARG